MLLWWIACHGTIEVPNETDAPPDEAAALFAPDHLVEITIDMPPEDWETLRFQGRDIVDMLTGDCLAAPFPSPYTWFSGDVTIDGVAYPNIGVRKKALIGSASSTKPGLKLEFDANGGEDAFGLDKLTLNNSVQDPAITRQCLGYQVFAAAGVPAPRCNFARVRVNGVDLGTYVNVEGVDEGFLERHDAAGADLWEGTLSDFRVGWTTTFDPKTGGDLAILDAVTVAAADPEPVAALDRVLDLDAYFDFWATEVLIGHWDGYAGNNNNFFVYHDGEDLRFLPWGIDGTMGPRDPFGGGARSVVANAAVPNRLYHTTEGRDRYVAAMRGVLDRAWDEDHLLGELDRMQALIGPQGENFDASQAALRDFIRFRRADIEAELDRPPSLSTALRNPPCLVASGTVEASFSTTWGTIGVADPFTTGAADLSFIWQGNDVPLVDQGSVAGIIAEGTPTPSGVAVAAHISADQIIVPYVVFDPNTVVLGAEVAIDHQNGALLYGDTTTGGQLTQAAFYGRGTLVLDAFGTDPGDVVSGHFSVPLLTPGGQ